MSAHFTKPAKPVRVIHRQRPKYIDNSKGQTPGFSTGKGNIDWAAHHILCCACFGLIQASLDDDPKKQQYVEDCLWIANWNINEARNMVGLPKKLAYEKSNCQSAAPADLPAHDVDHNSTAGYTDKVTAYLNKNVWQELNDASKKHEHNAKAIEDALNLASDHWRGELIKFGKRGSATVTGTKDCWEARLDKPNKSWSAARQQSYKQCTEWYKPFSMAPVANPRSPGVDWSNMTGIFEFI